MQVFKKIFFFGYIFFFYSCTNFLFRFGYNHLDTFLYRRIDHYFALNPDQKTWVKRKLKELLAWHREKEIPLYIEIIEKIQIYGKDGLSLTEVEDIWQKVEERREELMEKIIPPAAYILSTLTQEQIDHFEKRALEDIEEIEEEENLPQEEKEKIRFRRYLKPYEDWYGSVSRDQKENLIFLAKKVPSFRDGLAEFRKKRLKEFLQEYQEKKSNLAALENLLKKYLLKPWENYPPERKTRIEAFFSGLKKFIVSADELATPKQRANFLENLEKWRSRLREVYLD